MAIPIGSSPDPVAKPVPAPRTWKVIITMTDTPGNREVYLTKEQVINTAVYANRVHGLHIVSTTASLTESLGRKVQSKEEKENKNA